MYEGKTQVRSQHGFHIFPQHTLNDELFCVVHQMIYIGCAFATVYLIYAKFRATYDGNHDSFRVEFLVVPVGGLAVLINHDFSLLEVGTISFIDVKNYLFIIRHTL